jgi:signal transduction histidine kinase
MATQSITVELDDETIRDLAAIGKPIDVLAQLAHAAADGVRHDVHDQRERTDVSLRVERDRSDVAITKDRSAVDQKADDIVRIARDRADQVVQAAREEADSERSPQSTASEAVFERARTRADDVLEDERSHADAVVAGERAKQEQARAGLLAAERDATDKDLDGERGHADTLFSDQREANAEMVAATIRAHQLMAEAEAAKDLLERSARELREVAEFRELFIGILGHDLRNPLGAIVMSAGTLLQRGHLDDPDAQTVARIIRASHRMTRMVAQVLDLTRARLGGGIPIEPMPTDLSEVCRNIVGEFEAGILLDVEGDLNGTWDEDRLAQVLSNIVGNAVAYGTPGTDVIVKARADGEDVVVEITNHGAPVSADQLPFLFDPFRRAGEERGSSKTGNLGLGLYIAKQIVLAHRGTLDARSSHGTTTFVLRLPREAKARPLNASQG